MCARSPVTTHDDAVGSVGPSVDEMGITYRAGPCGNVGSPAGGAGALALLALPAAATVNTTPHYYSGDSTTADAYGGGPLTWTGTPTYASGHDSGQGFSVTPTSFLTVPDSTVGNLGTGDFTVKATPAKKSPPIAPR